MPSPYSCDYDVTGQELTDWPETLSSRWVGRQDSVGPAPLFFGSGGPQTGVWWTKMEGEEFTDDMKIEFEPNRR